MRRDHRHCQGLVNAMWIFFTPMSNLAPRPRTALLGRANDVARDEAIGARPGPGLFTTVGPAERSRSPAYPVLDIIFDESA